MTLCEQTPIVLTFEGVSELFGMRTITLAAFLAPLGEGQFDPEECRDILTTLAAGQTYRSGGGASPSWSVRVATIH